MKKLFLIILLFLLSKVSYSQEREFPVNNEGEVVYERVIKVNESTKENLYDKATDWFVLNYKSSNNVIQLRDDQRSKIIGKGTFELIHWMGNTWDVSHTITIQTKEGRYKVQISQISFKARTMKGSCSNTFSMNQEKNNCLGRENYFILKTKADDKIYQIIESIEAHLSTNQKNEEEDDW